MQYVAPIAVGLLYALVMSLVREPHRRRLNAVMVAGAGAAYLSGGGLGGWEFAFTAVLTYVAFRGLESWTWIGVGWLLHTVWDVVHHIKGNPIIPFAHTSSLGCAVCDPVIALWCLRGGPSLTEWVRDLRGARHRQHGPATAADRDRDEAGRGGAATAASPTAG
ncbi:hypothetical protein SUDANB108_04797 [Streptomyces sp. enrichment culture]|uniref:DUF6010 family protein n=1 Tax=Streptomyces sp. enrichment culture TaxID=1795815 RepID=UPI003F550A58